MKRCFWFLNGLEDGKKLTVRKWLERRFWDFRYGHGTYLAYAIGLFNFIVVNYYLLISNVRFLSRLFPSLWIFAVVFASAYFPTAIVVGWLVYRKRQFKTDTEVAALENPYRFKSVVPSKETVLALPLEQLLIRMVMKFYEKEGILTLEEKKEFQKYLRMINILMEGESIEQ